MNDGKYVILCIDDDADFREVTKLVLDDAGYIVKSAASAEEGLRAYKEEKPDLLIVDLMMEEVDSGTTFVKDIRLLGDIPPVYLLSGVGDSLSMTTDYSELGLAGVLQKPINPALLLKTIKSKLA